MSSEPISPFVLRQTANNPFSTAAIPVKTTQAVVAPGSVKGVFKNSPAKGYNPFLTAISKDNSVLPPNYGVNRPLPEPMFLGYHNDKPLFGGQRLFVLY